MAPGFENTYIPGSYRGDIFLENSANLNVKNLIKSYFNTFYRGNVSVGNRTNAIFTNNGIQEVLENDTIFK
jgi:hypothetical protein